MILQRAEWLVVNENGAENRVIANDVCQAAENFEDPANRVTQVTRDHLVKDVFEDPQISFTTKVEPAGAVAAGCTAYPHNLHQKEEFGTVIFSAHAEGGWNFVGWFLDGSLLSADAEALLPINRSTVTTHSEYEARFSN